jgi:hypothetical protein
MSKDAWTRPGHYADHREWTGRDSDGLPESTRGINYPPGRIGTERRAYTGKMPSNVEGTTQLIERTGYGTITWVWEYIPDCAGCAQCDTGPAYVKLLVSTLASTSSTHRRRFTPVPHQLELTNPAATSVAATFGTTTTTDRPPKLSLAPDERLFLTIAAGMPGSTAGYLAGLLPFVADPVGTGMFFVGLVGAPVAAWRFTRGKTAKQPAPFNGEKTYTVESPSRQTVLRLQQVANLLAESDTVAATYGDLLRELTWEYRAEFNSEELGDKVAQLLAGATALREAELRREQWVNQPDRKRADMAAQMERETGQRRRELLTQRLDEADVEHQSIRSAITTLEARALGSTAPTA